MKIGKKNETTKKEVKKTKKNKKECEFVEENVSDVFDYESAIKNLETRNSRTY